MIDIHTHILPDVDDGARNLEESLAMARIAVKDGIHHIVATPHHTDWALPAGQGDITPERLRSLQEALDAEGIDLRLYLGSEVRISPDLAQRMKQYRTLTLNNSRYVLVELPFLLYPSYVEQVFFELALEGFVPVLAHAERYAAIQKEPEKLTPLVGRGNLVQITSNSLTGTFGEKAQEAGITLLERGLAHIMASDAHNTTSRPPRLFQAVAVAAEYIGMERAQKMVNEIPRAILNNTPIAMERPAPTPPHRWRWFGRW